MQVVDLFFIKHGWGDHMKEDAIGESCSAVCPHQVYREMSYIYIYGTLSALMLPDFRL